MPAAPRYPPPDSIWKQTVLNAPYPDNLPPLRPAQERFKDLKFGLFVHWGLYSVLGHGEWALYKEHIPIEDYDRLVDDFTAESFDAQALGTLAKRAGVRYLNFVTKHHDGFCLFNSALTDHTSVKKGPHRDFVAEVSRACAAAGLPLFLYYSLLDWHFPDFSPDCSEYRKYYHAQVEELATNYGPLAGFWFDMGDLLARYHGQATWEMLRERQPEALIPQEFFVGERTLTHTSAYDPQGRLLNMPLPAPAPDAWPLEVCDTMNRSWGYKPSDTNYRSAEELLRQLVTAVGKGANLLLNVSPTPSGAIPPEQVQRLEYMGDFLERYGEAVYGTRPALLATESWGFAVTKEQRLLLHVVEPQDEFTVQGLGRDMGEVTRVSTLEGKPVPWRQDPSGLHVQVPLESRHPVDTILEVVLRRLQS